MKLSTKILAVAFVAAIALVAVPALASFDSNLTIGSTGADVVALQTTLVAGGQLTMPAGVNMGYFGALTQAAVAKYQVANGITPAVGYFGPITRAALNAGGVVTPAGALCPNGMTLASNCTLAANAQAVPLCPNGMTLASNCATAPGTTVPTVNTEGSFTATLAANPSAQTGITATQNVPIIGFNIKALDSDITINRVDLQVGVTYATGTLVPSAFINGVSVLDGSTVLMSKSVTSADFEKDSTGVYYIRLSGLNFTVAKDATKTLTIAMSVNTIGGSDVAKTITVLGYGAQGIRGTDTAGYSQYEDATGLTRAQAFGISGVSTLTASADVNLVDSASIKIDAVDGAKNVSVFSFNVKSTTGDSVVTDVRFDVTGTAATSMPSTLYLYDGSTQIGSMTATASTTFTDLLVSVPKNVTKTLTVKADFPTTGTANQTGTVSLRAAGVTYDKPDGSSAATANALVAGNPMYQYPTSIGNLALVSATSKFVPSSDTASSTISGTITMSLKADGGTVTLPTASDFVVYFASSTVKADALASGYLATTTAVAVSVSPSQDITDGSSATVTYTATLTHTAANTGNLYMVLYSAKVRATAVSTQTWGLDDFFTPVQYLY
jgi:hypothetical protein